MEGREFKYINTLYKYLVVHQVKNLRHDEGKLPKISRNVKNLLEVKVPKLESIYDLLASKFNIFVSFVPALREDPGLNTPKSFSTRNSIREHGSIQH